MQKRSDVSFSGLTHQHTTKITPSSVRTHELDKLDILRVLPPLLPIFAQEVGRDGDVSDRGIKPHVEHLVAEAILRHRGACARVMCAGVCVRKYCAHTLTCLM